MLHVWDTPQRLEAQKLLRSLTKKQIQTQNWAKSSCNKTEQINNPQLWESSQLKIWPRTNAYGKNPHQAASTRPNDREKGECDDLDVHVLSRFLLLAQDLAPGREPPKDVPPGCPHRRHRTVSDLKATILRGGTREQTTEK